MQILTTLLARGGPLMPVLFLVSVLATATVLVKLYHFRRCRLRSLTFVEPALERIAAGDTEDALRILAATRNPVARALEAGVSHDDPKSEMVRVGTAELRHLEGGLRMLSSIAQLSPLLGLLGTVWGMISAFAELEKAGSLANPSLLSGGISAALLTTAFGLIIAIPATAALHYLEGEIDAVLAAMKDTQIRMLWVLHRGDGNKRAGEGIALRVADHGA